MTSPIVFPKKSKLIRYYETKKYSTGHVAYCALSETGNAWVSAFALYLGIIDLAASIILLICTNNYYLLLQIGIQAFLNLIQSFDLFVGFIVVCYVTLFQFATLLMIIGCQGFASNRYAVSNVSPGIYGSDRYWFMACGYFMLFWFAFRIFWANRAIHSMTVTECKKRGNNQMIAALEA